MKRNHFNTAFLCRYSLTILALFLLACTGHAQSTVESVHVLRPVNLEDVHINDPFWGPKFKVWTSKTVYDVFDKLEGKYTPDRKDIIDEKEKLGRTRNAFLNFDRVARGQKDTKEYDGPPWYDGLVYETIRGAADLLVEYPDVMLEQKIDAYIDRIVAAQSVDPDGYINTYTTLNQSHQRWGTNGGNDRWQHDLYNAGMLVDAAIHYYKATGKSKLLEAAVKLGNYMYQVMGPATKKNIIPGHGGPEEALVKLYWLFKAEPGMKKKLSVLVDETQYLSLARFWIETRGNHGMPDGSYSRKSDGIYNQDHQSVFEQQTIEGHAVRATLLASGVAAVALDQADDRYVQTAVNYWNNMAGKRMFITGGVGAIAEDEKFGPNYFLPESAYLETCAAIGAGFFSQRMNQLQADGKYIDELERVLYNNVLSGVSLHGDRYFYENPLMATDHKRWQWHSCPCCPPMFLKMVSALPGFIYAQDDESIYVNLFIGSDAQLSLKNNKVSLKQVTEYPWKGGVAIQVSPASSDRFTVKIRIPGWAQGQENPFDLYRSSLKGTVRIKVNGKMVQTVTDKGYALINRQWKKGDRIELNLPVQPRLIVANDSVEAIRGKVAMAAGPIIYSVEGIESSSLETYVLPHNPNLSLSYKPDLLNGVNTITGKAFIDGSKQVPFIAIPFYAIANRSVVPYRVWITKKQ